MTNAHNAHLQCANSPLIHYARRPRDEIRHTDAGTTTCNVPYYVGQPPPARPHNLVRAVIVDEPVTCVICAIDYAVWP